MVLRRRGFSLIEVIIGLSVATMVVILAREILSAAGQGARHVSAASTRHNKSANASVLLRSLLRSALSSDADSAAFVGTSRFAAFRSWCATAGGWKERCSVIVLVDSAEGRRALALYINGDSQRLVVREGAQSASLCYLKSVEQGGEWLPVWAGSNTLPLALGIVVEGDTSILKIGETG